MKKILLILLIIITPITVEAKSKYLYDVIKDESESNGLAKEYVGPHQDSPDASSSQERIYYWTSTDGRKLLEIMNKNNVIFGDYCWKMIRTTDTGGVKLLYNGPVVNNKCAKEEGNYQGYVDVKEETISGTYYYGDSYDYDPETKKYTIKDNLILSSINTDLIGKYTCKSNSETAKCNTLYLIKSLKGTNKVESLTLGTNTIKSQFGTLPFNKNNQSLTSVGYKYGKEYSTELKPALVKENFLTTYQEVLSEIGLNTSYWYSDTVECNTSSNLCKLINAFQPTSTSAFPSLIGKYTQNYQNNYVWSPNLYYITEITRTTSLSTYVNAKKLDADDYNATFNPIIFGDSITDNGNGTFTLNNTQSVDLAEWDNTYSSYKYKFTCNGNISTCENPRYVTSVSNKSYNYLDYNNKVLIAKERNGLELEDTIIIPKYELLNNFNSYTDYKYTCKNTNSTCTESELKMISSIDQNKSITYVPNYYYGSSITWNGSEYTLVDPIPMENYNNMEALSTHHYYCGAGQTKCSVVNYIFNSKSSNTPYYDIISLSDGVESIADAIDDMLSSNINDSIIKTGVEAWYKKNLLTYDEFIEDTIYCNNRSIKNKGGWSHNNDITKGLSFKESREDLSFTVDGYISTQDLSCPNNTDKFSVNNEQAKLNYKVGLLTTNEWNLSELTELDNIYKTIWHMTPSHFNPTGQSYAFQNITSMSASSTNYYPTNFAKSTIGSFATDRSAAVRPAISLIPSIKYSSGIGSMEEPYVIDCNTYYSINVEVNNETEDLNIEIEDLSTVPEGEEVNFKITPIKGFKVNSIRIIDESNNEIDYTTTDNKNYSFTMPATDVTIIPSYERVKNSVNVEENINTKEFIIEVNDAQAVVYEDTVRFKVEPEEGYEVEDIDITDEEQNKISYKKTNNQNEYEFIMPDTNVLIKPKYRLIPSNNSNLPNPNTKRQLLLIFISIFIIGILTYKYKKKRLT